jgi:hypothetical protein
MGWKPMPRYDLAVAGFTRVIEAFNDRGISYVIVGGLATVLHGHLRVTADVDFVIRLDDGNVRKAIDMIAIKSSAGRAIDLEDVKSLSEIRKHG